MSTKTSPRVSNRGSVTLEAALILPIVLFVLYGFILINQLIITDDEVSKGLNETARYIAKDAYGDEEYKPSAFEMLTFREYIDKNKLAMVDGGVSGVVITYNKSDDDVLHINASYSVHISLPLIGNYSFWLTDTSAVRPFDGFDKDRLNADDEYVYVAETGGVYHTDMNCTYISVRIVDINDSGLKNKPYCLHYDIVARNASSLYNIDHVDDEMRLLDRIDSELDMRLLLLKPVRLEASIENGIIKVDEDYSAKHPLWDRFGIDSYNYKIKARVELGDFADVIRKKRVLDDMKELKNDEQIQH